MHVGHAIKLMRVGRGLSQVELAQAADCSANYLSLVERGHRTPSLSFVEKVASALGASGTDVFVLAGERKEKDSDPERDELLTTLRNLLILLASPER